MSGQPFLSKRGDYRNLLCYKLSLIVSHITDYFVTQYIPCRSRTTDQMQQAARSCKQNIVEGSAASTTSTETEIKLTNVARASLAELEEDYRDYLLFNQLELWRLENPRLERLRRYIKTEDFKTGYLSLLPKLNAEEYCNLAITLIKQTQYLLDRMIASQQARFLTHGGIREQMTRARIEYRNLQGGNNRRDRNYRNNQNNQNNRNYQNYQKKEDNSNNSDSSDNSDNSDSSDNSNR